MAPRPQGNASKRKSTPPLPVLHPHAAGIDIGARDIYVAVPPGSDPRPVRSFPTFTEDLHALRDWLKACRVTTVAMESTGVYWIPLFQLLEASGIEVCLVNARHCRNLPGRKTDVQDCQWLQHLHAVGLLRGSFRPADQVCAVRTILRHRDALVRGAGRCVSHLHRALTQMNVQLHHVISDLTGVTGQAILEAILGGERDPQRLAALKDHRIKASRDVIAKSLQGDWRDEHLFTLRQTHALWQQHRRLIAECDMQIETMLRSFDSKAGATAAPLPPQTKSSHRKAQRNEPQFAAREECYRVLGVDLTAVPGFATPTVLVLVCELGPEFAEKFATAKQFGSWLGLCPDNRITGGKIYSVKTRDVKSPDSESGLAAQSLWQAKNYFGDLYRRWKARLGSPKAITAMAHKLARILWHLLKFKEPFNPEVFAREEEEKMKRKKLPTPPEHGRHPQLLPRSKPMT